MIHGFEVKLELYYDYIISFLFTHSSDPQMQSFTPYILSKVIKYILSSTSSVLLLCNFSAVFDTFPTSSLFPFSCHKSFLLIFHISLCIYLNLLFFPVFLPFKCLNSLFSPFSLHSSHFLGNLI